MEQGLLQLWASTGLYNLTIGQVFMIATGGLLIFLAISKGFEPLLLIPIGFGGILANIPVAAIAGPDGLLGILYHSGIETGVFPLLIFMGVGAMTDFGPLLARPSLMILGAAAQFGIFFTLFGAIAMNMIPGMEFSMADAAASAIIGGADGPTAIYVASRLAPELLGAIAVAAYSYMALVPIIQPPIMKLLTTEEERKTKMTQLRHVGKLEKILFPLTLLLIAILLLPSATPLIGMLCFGNLLKECGVVDRLSNTAKNELINIVTIFLGLAVGSKLAADKFLTPETMGILLLGMVAFSIGTAAGLIMGKIMYRITGGEVNPLIGAAGVSAVPMAARVANKVGLEANQHNFLLMHAMDPYRESEIQPGEAVQSDEEIDAFVRGEVESAYHPSCACRMGEDDMAVVDSKTRVHGIEGLRVVDSSIFPVIPNGNLNSPTIMLAERAADIIKGKGMLKPSDVAVGLGEDWENKQRSTSAN